MVTEHEYLEKLEVYSNLKTPKKPFFIRLDGWRFHRLTKRLKLRTPFDQKFAHAIVNTAKRFFIPFNARLGFCFSDEINLLFTDALPFDGRIEKIDSIFTGLASCYFLGEFKKEFKKEIKEVSFDCRVIPLRKSEVIKYLDWRQAETWRNHNNAYAYWILRGKGYSPRSAQKILDSLKTGELMELAREHGVDLLKTPGWQRKGVLLYKEQYWKDGYNPITKRKIRVKRYRVKEIWDPPLFYERAGKELIKKILLTAM